MDWIQLATGGGLLRRMHFVAPDENPSCSIITKRQIPGSKGLFEKLIVPHLVTEFPSAYGSFFCRVQKILQFLKWIILAPCCNV